MNEQTLQAEALKKAEIRKLIRSRYKGLHKIQNTNDDNEDDVSDFHENQGSEKNSIQSTFSWFSFLFTSIVLPFFVILIAYNSSTENTVVSIGITIYTTIIYGLDVVSKSQALQFLALGEKIVSIEQATKVINDEQKDNQLEEIKQAVDKISNDEPKRIVLYLSLALMQIIAIMAML